jgi:hypothetical protein
VSWEFNDEQPIKKRSPTPVAYLAIPRHNKVKHFRRTVLAIYRSPPQFKNLRPQQLGINLRRSTSFRETEIWQETSETAATSVTH